MKFTKIDGNQLEQTAQPASSSPLPPPDKKTVESFQHSLHKHDEEDGQQQHPQTPTDSIASLFNQRMAPMPESVSASQPNPLPSPDLDQLVDQILVGRSADGGHEIRLHIDPKILPGTEIHIQQNQDGFLHVHLISNNAPAFQTLVSSQDILQQRLQDSGSQARVTVSSGAESENNDSNRRSRGYIDPADERPS
ncbi:MAG: flagellar hook-length control protein FliK [Desulfomicrobium sp.]|jgi:type III secretion system needle length determinant|nr:flagellar hook-length control protein FliK [Desulfomicrobium sp.]